MISLLRLKIHFTVSTLEYFDRKFLLGAQYILTYVHTIKTNIEGDDLKTDDPKKAIEMFERVVEMETEQGDQVKWYFIDSLKLSFMIHISLLITNSLFFVGDLRLFNIW